MPTLALETASRSETGRRANNEDCVIESSRLDAALADAVAWGNQTIGFIAECQPQLTGMSTTLTAIALDDDGAYVLANIGDSRTYLLRDGALTQLTRDDSFVQELIDRGHLTAAQASTTSSRETTRRRCGRRP